MPLPPLFFSFNCESVASVWRDGFRTPESKCLCPEELLCYSHNIRRELNMKKLGLIEEGHMILELTTPLPNCHLHKWKLGIVSKADWCTTHTPTSYKALFLTVIYLRRAWQEQSEFKTICKKKSWLTGTNPDRKKEIASDHIVTEVISIFSSLSCVIHLTNKTKPAKK